MCLPFNHTSCLVAGPALGRAICTPLWYREECAIHSVAVGSLCSETTAAINIILDYNTAVKCNRSNDGCTTAAVYLLYRGTAVCGTAVCTLVGTFGLRRSSCSLLEDERRLACLIPME